MSATEKDILTPISGTFTLPELYALVEGSDAAARDHGHDVIHGISDTRWRRRLRGYLQTLRRQGKADRLGASLWVIHGTPEQPRTAVLVSRTGRDIELRLSTALDLLRGLDEPADLVFADPPWALAQGTGPRDDVAARTSAAQDREAYVVPGYVDVPAADYRDFTNEWITAAAAAIRPGGYLCVVTGAQQAAWVQVFAELAGLTYCNSLAIGKVFALRSTRRFAHAHWRASILCRGPLASARRAFTPPPDLPKARSGADYPLDLWEIGSVGRVQHRAGTERYRNELPPRLVARLLGALTCRPTPEQADLVVEPYFGGGSGALTCLQMGLRYIGCDVNEHALPYVMRRLTRAATPTPAGPARRTRPARPDRRHPLDHDQLTLGLGAGPW